jgi:pilus assembly protein CpaF
MRIWYHNLLGADRCVAEIVGDRVRIGRRRDNDIVLESHYLADEAIRLARNGDAWELAVLGENGCTLDDVRLERGDKRVLNENSEIEVFPFRLTLEPDDHEEDSDEARRRHLEGRASDLIRDVHSRLLSLMDCGAGQAARDHTDDYLMALERHIEEIARLEGMFSEANTALVEHMAGACVRSHLVERLIEEAGRRPCTVFEAPADWSRVVTAVPDREQELAAISGSVAKSFDLVKHTDLSVRMDRVEQSFWPAWSERVARLLDNTLVYLALRQLKKQIKDIVFGYGPLEDLLRTPSVTEIMVVRRDRIYIEKNGIIENSGRQFISDEVTETIIERIVSKVGRRIDRSQPLVDARLTDGSRVNAVIAPLAVSGPCLTIRKFPLQRLTIDDLIELGSITPTVAEFLRAAVIARRNILISGGTGSGKTTLLNCLGEFIPEKERIVTVEDTAELQLHKEHVVRIEAKKANAEGNGAYSIHDLVKNALRMRPDRIIVGECRGAEALDMLQAMNTGHDGSLTTIHANSAQDVLLRLEVMVQSAANLPIASIHRQVASAIDLVVQVTRRKDGSRCVSQVTEFVDVDPEQGGIRTKDLFLLDGENGGGQLHPTGRLPTFMGQLIEKRLIRLESFYLDKPTPEPADAYALAGERPPEYAFG